MRLPLYVSHEIISHPTNPNKFLLVNKTTRKIHYAYYKQGGAVVAHTKLTFSSQKEAYRYMLNQDWTL